MENGQPNTDSCGQKRRYPKAGWIDFNYYLTYDDGKLFWKNPPTNRTKEGQEAGWVSGNGYRLISLKNNILPAHHIIWFMFYGCFTHEGLELDHIDMNKLNNRIENLRVATRSQNARNKLPRGKTSKYKGVDKLPSGNYRASLNNKHLGVYSTEEEAAVVWNTYAKKCCSYTRLNDVFSNLEVAND